MVGFGERKRYGSWRRHVDALHGATVELTDDDSFLVCAVSRDSLPVGCRNLKVPALLKTKEWVPMGEIAASHPSYKFGDSRGFKIDGILCFNCFASAWPLELRQFGSFKGQFDAGLPSGCLAVDRAVDRAIATKIRISLHSRSRLSPTGDQMLPGRPSVSENSLAGSWT